MEEIGMKKILILALFFLFLFSLIACGRKTQPKSASQEFQYQANANSTSEKGDDIEQSFDEESNEDYSTDDMDDELNNKDAFIELSPQDQADLIDVIDYFINEYDHGRNELPDEYAPLPKGLIFPSPLSPEKFSVTYNEYMADIVDVTIPIDDDAVVIWVRGPYPDYPEGFKIVSAYNRNGRTSEEISLPIRHRSDALDLVRNYLHLEDCYKTAIPGAFYYENKNYQLWEGGFGYLKDSGKLVYIPSWERKEWDSSKEGSYNRRYYFVYADTGKIQLITSEKVDTMVTDKP